SGALLSARWLYRSWTARKVAAELQAETRGNGVGTRVTWRPWSSGALVDDGLLELEVRARHTASPFRLKFGASRFPGGGNLAQARDRYGMLECTLAKDAGRTLSAHALRRATGVGGSRASSTTVGARLTLGSRRGGRHSFLVESTRAERTAAAWGLALPPSGG